MQLLTLALATSSLLGSALAVPLEARGGYHWSVTQWSFSRGEDSYDYSFMVSGPASKQAPGFVATCSGETQQGGYKQCSILPPGPQKNIPNIYAKVKVVTDPNDPNDSIPRVFVKETWNRKGCEYTQIGQSDATENSGSTSGSKFSIYPKISAVC